MYLKTLDLKGFETEGLIIKIVDGDTIQAKIDIPIQWFYEEPRSRPDNTFPCRLNCRLMGINAAERHEPLGPVATQQLTDKLKSLGNRVYLKIHGLDKYGRHLATVYDSENKERDINQELLQCNGFIEYKM